MKAPTMLVVWGTLTVLQQTPAPQAPPPDTEIFLAPLKMTGERLSVGVPRNISNSPGYDNQPSFSPDGGSIFFTSARGEVTAGARGPQMDIYRYDIATARVAAVTRTPESEYSPTVTPDGGHISVIRVEADGTQRLWSFTLAGTDPALVLTEIKPVGYHAWIDANTLALFVLGQPATLQVADVKSGTAQVAARDIGRSLQKIPGGGVSFIQREGDAAQRKLTISEAVMSSGKPVTRPLTTAPAGATEEFVAWAPDGTLLMSAAGKLYGWRRGGDWSVIADLSAGGLSAVSRLAVSPKGDWLALVAQSSAPK